MMSNRRLFYIAGFSFLLSQFPLFFPSTLYTTPPLWRPTVCPNCKFVLFCFCYFSPYVFLINDNIYLFNLSIIFQHSSKFSYSNINSKVQPAIFPFIRKIKKKTRYFRITAAGIFGVGLRLKPREKQNETTQEIYLGSKSMALILVLM